MLSTRGVLCTCCVHAVHQLTERVALIDGFFGVRVNDQLLHKLSIQPPVHTVTPKTYESVTIHLGGFSSPKNQYWTGYSPGGVHTVQIIKGWRRPASCLACEEGGEAWWEGEGANSSATPRQTRGGAEGSLEVSTPLLLQGWG